MVRSECVTCFLAIGRKGGRASGKGLRGWAQCVWVRGEEDQRAATLSEMERRARRRRYPRESREGASSGRAREGRESGGHEKREVW